MGDTKRPPPSITKTDSAFEGDGIEFCWGVEAVDLAQLNDLFEKVRVPSPAHPRSHHTLAQPALCSLAT